MNCSVTLSFGLAAQDATRIPASDNMCDKKSFMTHFSLWATDGEATRRSQQEKCPHSFISSSLNPSLQFCGTITKFEIFLLCSTQNTSCPRPAVDKT